VIRKCTVQQKSHARQPRFARTASGRNVNLLFQDPEIINLDNIKLNRNIWVLEMEIDYDTRLFGPLTAIERDRIAKTRVILRNKGFLRKSLDDKQIYLNLLLAKGLREDHLKILLREKLDEDNALYVADLPIGIDSNKAKAFELLPFEVFSNLVLSQNLKAKDLLSLCNTSNKLHEYCNKSDRLFNVKTGQTTFESYALFRKILAKQGFSLQPWQNPRMILRRVVDGGVVYATGSNSNGVLGIEINGYGRSGKIISYTEPNSVDTFSKTFGKVITSGKGGTSISPDPNTPNIISISAGFFFAAFLEIGGTVSTIGKNYAGELSRIGNMSTVHRIKSNRDRRNMTYIPSDMGGDIFTGDEELENENNSKIKSLPVDYEGEIVKDIIQVSCGRNRIAAIDRKGNVYFHTPGTQHSSSRVWRPKEFVIVQVACGSQDIYMLDNLGRIHVLGYNNLGGEERVGGEYVAVTPFLIEEYSHENDNGIVFVTSSCYNNITAFVNSKGVPYVFGSDSDNIALPKRGITRLDGFGDQYGNRIVQISIGRNHLGLLDIKGRVYTMGIDSGGSTGHGFNIKGMTVDVPTMIKGSGFDPDQEVSNNNNPDKRVIKIACGETMTAFIDYTGQLYVTGFSPSGALGLKDTSGKSIVSVGVPTLVPGMDHCYDVSLGSDFSLVLKAE